MIAFVPTKAAKIFVLFAIAFASPLLNAPWEEVAFAQQVFDAPTSISIRELSRTPTSVTLQIDFPTPKFDTANGTSTLRKLSEQLGNGDPFSAISLAVRAEASSSVTLGNLQQGSVAVPRDFIIPALSSDQIFDGKPGSYLPQKSKRLPANHAGIGTLRITYAGKARAVDLSSLMIGCYDFDARLHVLHYAKRIVLTVSSSTGFANAIPITSLSEAYTANAATFHSRLATENRNRSNGKQSAMSAGDIQQTPGLRADDGFVYRMYVHQDGIYHITFDDLKQFGLDPSTVDPTTLRIISQGQQVPVYVFDHQDGHFDPNDYFEFFGEEKTLKYNSKYGDEYYDPWTHYNVYYLVWGTKYSSIPQGGVKRLVEESGEIREADRTKFIDLKNSSFRSRLHYERDNFYENLENTDLNDLSSLRDHSFTAEVRTAQSVELDTVTPYPDLENGKPFTLRVAFHGISHFDPGTTGTHGQVLPDVPNEHQPDVSVNGTHLLFGIWDSQVMHFLSTDTLSQRILLSPPQPSLLKANVVADSTARASFPLAVRIESKVKTDVLFCNLGINWFNLDYDRLYAAYQNQFQFSIPQASPSALYQFTLSNFTRSDISIYRKGVSKISNFFIDASSPNQSGIKAIFQLNVASDADQFYATVDSLKLKPARYQRDGWADLRNPANAGAYLIITNHEHLNKNSDGVVGQNSLQLLLDERKQRMNVSAKLIDVANIYDEFSFGARSPQAIKDFLQYGYDNWQDPPRYVLLVGTTHIGTDDTLKDAPPEQVPTFYFQSYSYGSTSTDTWYSLLDGNDLIPDILIGRLPSTTLAQDNAYYNKIVQFDNQSSLGSLWKDRALFLSGEHLNGNDFYGQITALLASSVPTNAGVERQGLDLTLPYYGTDKELVSAINDGIWYLHFMGHGGLGVWADPIPFTSRSLFIADDAKRLTNLGHYPFISSLTCFTGAFDGSTVGALLPAMLLQSNAGAIAAIGTSSFGFRDEDVRLAEKLLPRMFDTIPSSFASRTTAAKIDYFLTNDPIGNLIDPTIALSYIFLGDPMVGPYAPTDQLQLALSTRALQPGQTVTITGTSSIQAGSARIELIGEGNEPLWPAHVIASVPFTNGTFSVSDVVPAGISDSVGAYHVVVTASSGNSFARATSDVTFTAARVSALKFTPHQVGPGTNIDLSAAVQSPSGVQSAWAVVHIYTQDAAGLRSIYRTDSVQMTATGDLYHYQISGNGLANSMVVSAYVLLNPTSGPTVASNIVQITIGASSDPAAFRDYLHHNLVGRYRSTSTGLLWQEAVYNWGSVDAQNVTVTLSDTTTKQVLSTLTLPVIPAHGSTVASFNLDATTLDTLGLTCLVAAENTTTPLSLRDSSIYNDTTFALVIARGAVAYATQTGTTLDGVNHAVAQFDGGKITIEMQPQAESTISKDVIRVARLPQLPVLQQYANEQPDVHFLKLPAKSKQIIAGYRVASDSLGAIPLTVPIKIAIKIDLTDTATIAHQANLYVYRQDDRSKQWTILPTTRNQDILTATCTNLGNFVVAYHTDTRVPTVDLSVEGQVFLSNGDVPDKPHITAVMQDANGIDITPGKTIVKVDGRTLGATEFAMLDSLRTPTTANLHFEPQLTDGAHTISVQTTDNDGLSSNVQALNVTVSHNFVIRTLGSYPNPFSVQMFLAYEIKGIPFATSVQLNIYTVSGKLIRSLKFPSDDPNQTFGFLKGGTGVPTSLGYHEVWWDGHDDSGNEVANGAYFYKLFVKTPTDERDLTGKFARVR